ncbi:hypothetical protein NL676_029442 [Syzygium grande]|nr:hypothetical protein NL676_029442 [Syzygium grande]
MFRAATTSTVTLILLSFPPSIKFFLLLRPLSFRVVFFCLSLLLQFSSAHRFRVPAPNSSSHVKQGNPEG